MLWNLFGKKKQEGVHACDCGKDGRCKEPKPEGAVAPIIPGPFELVGSTPKKKTDPNPEPSPFI